MPFHICPNCKDRSLDSDGYEGFRSRCCSASAAARLPLRAARGLLPRALDRLRRLRRRRSSDRRRPRRVRADRLPGSATCSAARSSALSLSDTAPLELVREWGVRELGEQLEVATRAGFRKPVTADFFPAYDADGGLLVGLTPRWGGGRSTHSATVARVSPSAPRRSAREELAAVLPQRPAHDDALLALLGQALDARPSCGRARHLRVRVRPPHRRSRSPPRPREARPRSPAMSRRGRRPRPGTAPAWISEAVARRADAAREALPEHFVAHPDVPPLAAFASSSDARAVEVEDGWLHFGDDLVTVQQHRVPSTVESYVERAFERRRQAQRPRLQAQRHGRQEQPGRVAAVRGRQRAAEAPCDQNRLRWSGHVVELGFRLSV